MSHTLVVLPLVDLLEVVHASIVVVLAWEDNGIQVIWMSICNRVALGNSVSMGTLFITLVMRLTVGIISAEAFSKVNVRNIEVRVYAGQRTHIQASHEGDLVIDQAEFLVVSAIEVRLDLRLRMGQPRRNECHLRPEEDLFINWNQPRLAKDCSGSLTISSLVP